MRVAIDCRMLHNSGIGRYLRDLLPEILNYDEHSFVLLGNPDELISYISPNVKVVPLKYGVYNPLQHLELFFKVPDSDILFSPHFPTSFLPLRAKRRITTIHDVFHISDQSSFGFLKKVYARFLYRTSVKRSKRILTVSENSKNELEKYTGLNHSDVRVIYNSIDFSRFYHLRESERSKLRVDIRKHFGLSDSARFVLFVGNIKPHKNIVRMVKAFNRLNQKDLYLLIVGDAVGFLHRLPEFDKLADNNPMVRFTGKLQDDELLALYNLAEFLVFPSLYEGFGYPPLEAMACGTVAAVSDIPVLKEVCGEAVLYFDPLSEEDMTEKMKSLLEDSRLCNVLRSHFDNILARYARSRQIKQTLEAIFS